MTTKHTPIPWKVELCQDRNVFVIWGCDGKPVAEIVPNKGRNQANAEFVEQACNSHYELLAFTKATKGWFDKWGVNTPYDRLALIELSDIWAASRTLIAKAEGRAK